MAWTVSLGSLSPFARAGLKLCVLGGFTYWFYAFIAYNDPGLQAKYFPWVDEWSIPYKWGNNPDATRADAEFVFWVVVCWSVLLGGAILTTLAEKIRTDAKHHRIWRAQTRLNYVLDFQLYPRALWSWCCGGMSVRDALVICLFLFGVLWSSIKGFNKRNQRITGSAAVGIPLYTTKAALQSGYYAHELGTALRLPTWLLFLTVPHGSFLQTLTGLNYHAMIRYHRWVGNMMLIQVTVHGWLYYASWWQLGQFYVNFSSWDQTSSVGNVQGLISWICGAIIFITSFSFIRRRFFEVFYRFHVVFFLGYVIFGAIHAQEFFTFITPGLLLFGVDLVFRSISYMSVTSPSKAVVNSSADVAELTFDGRPGLNGLPMGRIYLALDGHSRWEWHPFSIAGRTYDGRITVAVKRYGKFTGRLLDAIRDREPLSLRVYVPREHAGIQSWKHEDSALVIAGGIGVTAALAVLDDIVLSRLADAGADADARGAPGLRSAASTANALSELGRGEGSARAPSSFPRRLTFVWVARSVDEFFVIRPRILAAAADPSGWLDLRLHCTASGGGASGQGGLKAVPSKALLAPPSGVVPGVPGTLRGGEGIPGIARESVASRGIGEIFRESLLRRQSAARRDGADRDDDDDAMVVDSGARPASPAADAAAGDDSARGSRGCESSLGSVDEGAAKDSRGSPPSSRSSNPTPSLGRPSLCPFPSLASPVAWSLPRPVTFASHSDAVWLLVHVFAFFGAFAGVCLVGAYSGEYVARLESNGESPDSNHYTWRQNGLDLLGFIVGGLGLPFVLAAFPYGVWSYYRDLSLARRIALEKRRPSSDDGRLPGATEAGKGAPAPPAVAGVLTPYDVRGARAEEPRATHVTKRHVSIADSDLGTDVLSGRPDIAELIARANEDAGRGGIVGVYVSGPEPMNKAVHDAVGRANHSRSGTLFVHHKITGQL